MFESSKIANISCGQDGAIYNGLLFRFDGKGNCNVHDLDNLKSAAGESAQVYASFTLDRADEITPHSNSVCFGRERFDESDEFPLLYTNIYNNYDGKGGDELWGVCAVYRLMRKGNNFNSTLVQLIEIGFSHDSELWTSHTTGRDKRPFGNFLVDSASDSYYAFVMRDVPHKTRFFRFDLPSLKDGKYDYTYNVKKVRLKSSDIIELFDVDYSNFLQGACVYDGCIYSVEGGTRNENNPAALKVIDLYSKEIVASVKLGDYGMDLEPEFIDYYRGECYYSDCEGNLFTLKITSAK